MLAKACRRHCSNEKIRKRHGVNVLLVRGSIALVCFVSFVWCFGRGFRHTPLSPLRDTANLVWSKVPPNVAIVVPYTQADLQKVLNAVHRWPALGDPCPAVRSMSTSPLHMLFWFNRDMQHAAWQVFAQRAKTEIASALQPVADCFASVLFDSAQLSDEEDPYPFGPTNQWYKLYLSPKKPLRPYDYFLWAEFDLVPVRGGWMDALLREVTFHEGFFVRGSIHRGSKLDSAVRTVAHRPMANPHQRKCDVRLQ